MALGVQPTGIQSIDTMFKVQVQVALSKLCPCNTISVDLAFNVQSVPFKGTREEFCECYCTHRASCNLIADLVASEQTYTIKLTLGGSKFLYLSQEILWNPFRIGGNIGENLNTPPSIWLGHELVHAVRLDKNQTVFMSEQGEEFPTVRGENQLRREMGEPMRFLYKGERVTRPGALVLDNRDRFDCCCGFLCRIFRALRNFFTFSFLRSNNNQEGSS